MLNIYMKSLDFTSLEFRFTLWKAQFHNKSDDENDEEKSHFLR